MRQHAQDPMGRWSRCGQSLFVVGAAKHLNLRPDQLPKIVSSSNGALVSSWS